MCEELARGELEVMERDARCAFFYQDQLSKIAVRAYQRQARDAVNQAVRIFRKLRSYDDATVFKGIQNRFEGRMEENGRTVAQVIGSEARDAARGQRSHVLHEHQVLLQAGERKKSS